MANKMKLHRDGHNTVRYIYMCQKADAMASLI